MIEIFGLIFYFYITSSMIGEYNCEYFEMSLSKLSPQVVCIDSEGDFHELNSLLLVDGRLNNKEY